MGWFDKFVQHEEDNMPRGTRIEEATWREDDSIEYTISTKDGKGITYSLSPEQAKSDIQDFYRKHGKRL